MANSITRYLKGIWYALIGRAYLQTDKLSENPEVVRGVYEDIIHAKQADIQRYKEVIGQLAALVERNKNLLKPLTNDIVELENKKAGTAQKAETIAAELREAGASKEEIERHPEYVRCVYASDDLDYTLKKKDVRVAKLERNIKRVQADIEHHKRRIISLHHDLDEIKTEQSESIEDIMAVREQEEIDNILSDISKDDTSEDE